MIFQISKASDRPELCEPYYRPCISAVRPESVGIDPKTCSEHWVIEISTLEQLLALGRTADDRIILESRATVPGLVIYDSAIE